MEERIVEENAMEGVPMRNTCLVIIMKGQGEEGYKVYPGHRHVHYGDSVIFEAIGCDATVSFPFSDIKPFGDNIEKFTLKPNPERHNHDSREFRVVVMPTPGKPIGIEYKVVCNGEPATGGSEPEMIIDP